MQCLTFICYLTGSANRDLADSVAVHMAGHVQGGWDTAWAAVRCGSLQFPQQSGRCFYLFLVFWELWRTSGNSSRNFGVFRGGHLGGGAGAPAP